tara:strand:+ start:962 stop:1093 length:132 start_codon:yes stop_codon:yes gene_type:complete
VVCLELFVCLLMKKKNEKLGEENRGSYTASGGEVSLWFLVEEN